MPNPAPYPKTRVLPTSPPQLLGNRPRAGSPLGKRGVSGAEIVDLITGLSSSQVENRCDYRSAFRQVNNQQLYPSATQRYNFNGFEASRCLYGEPAGKKQQEVVFIHQDALIVNQRPI